MKKRLFVDMDGTLAKFHNEVKYLERMNEKGFFEHLQPFDRLIIALSELSKNERLDLYILSSVVSPQCEKEKNIWLDKYMPFVKRENRIFVKEVQRKAECVGKITKNDYLYDDYNKNLLEWEQDGGSAIKCHNNINNKGLGAYGGERGKLWQGAIISNSLYPAYIIRDFVYYLQDFKYCKITASQDKVNELFDKFKGARIEYQYIKKQDYILLRYPMQNEKEGNNIVDMVIHNKPSVTDDIYIDVPIITAEPFEEVDLFEKQYNELSIKVSEIINKYTAFEWGATNSELSHIVSPSVKEGKYQLTTYDKLGAVGDMQFNDKTSLQKEVVSRLIEGNTKTIHTNDNAKREVVNHLSL